MIAHDWRNSNAVVFEPANAAAREQSVANIVFAGATKYQAHVHKSSSSQDN